MLRKLMKIKCSETKEQATCIRALQEPPPKLESVLKVSVFAMYVHKKLKSLDNRSRALMENS